MRAEVEKENFRKLQNFGPGHRSHDEKDIKFTMYVPLTKKHRMKFKINWPYGFLRSLNV